jgi:hypothetical protein
VCVRQAGTFLCFFARRLGTDGPRNWRRRYQIRPRARHPSTCVRATFFLPTKLYIYRETGQEIRNREIKKFVKHVVCYQLT